ncbi:MAG: hypothetical protein AAF708_07965 [Deinococcota bacterium]
MAVIGWSIALFAIKIVVQFITDKFVIPKLPGFIQNSAFTLRMISYVALFISFTCIIAWGYGHAVITLDSNQPFLNPLRWIWWALSAVSFGIEAAFAAEEKVKILASKTVA